MKKQPPITAGRGRAGQARAGRGAHTQEEAEGKVGRRQEEAANRDAGFCVLGGRFLIWHGFFIFFLSR